MPDYISPDEDPRRQYQPFAAAQDAVQSQRQPTFGEVMAQAQADMGPPVRSQTIKELVQTRMEAEQEARKAYDLSGGLPDEIKLNVEASYLGRTGEFDREAEVMQSLVSRYPDNLEYGLSLAIAHAKAGHLDQAYAALDRLRRTSAFAVTDPRIDLVEAWFADDEPKRRLAAAERAMQEGARREMRSLRDDALVARGKALECLGETEKAESSYDEARRIRAALGDRWGTAKAAGMLGALQYKFGDFAKAREPLQQSIEILREVGGNRMYEAEAMDRMGSVLMELGDHYAARKALFAGLSSAAE